MEEREPTTRGAHLSSTTKDVAHDLNNLLNTLGMVVHEAGEPSRTPAELRTALREIRSLLDLGEAIVDRIRSLALDHGARAREG